MINLILIQVYLFYDQSEQIKTYKERLKALYGYLDIEKKRMLIEDEEGLTHDPNFWDDPKKAESILKNIRSRKFGLTPMSWLKRLLQI